MIFLRGEKASGHGNKILKIIFSFNLMLCGPGLLLFCNENIEKLVFMHTISPNYTLKLDLTVVIILYVFFFFFQILPVLYLKAKTVSGLFTLSHSYAMEISGSCRTHKLFLPECSIYDLQPTCIPDFLLRMIFIVFVY